MPPSVLFDVGVEGIVEEILLKGHKKIGLI